MKRFLYGLALSLVILGLAIAPVFAETSGSAVGSVYVNVNPNIAVTPKTPIVNAGDIQTGDFSATLIFTVGANMEQIQMFVEASNLYKGDNPLDTTVPPILIKSSKPVGIVAQYGNRMNALPNEAEWGPAGAPIGDYPTIKTETVKYESSQNGHFSQDVSVKITYNQPDPEKPMGQYSGKVRLNVLL